ncbi:MAG: hypothetical protein ACOCP4_01155 [Candidatus Woesearchaeota archaeon]
MFMRMMKFKKGSAFIMTVLYLTVAISFLSFAVDTARLVYYRMYTKNLASSIGLSIVNECAYGYHDVENGARAVIVYDRQLAPPNYFEDDRFRQTALDSSLMDEILSKNGVNELKDYKVLNVNLNDGDYDRFEVGQDEINGEVEVTVTADIKVFFLQNILPYDFNIVNKAISQPNVHIIDDTLIERKKQEAEFEKYNFDSQIIFEEVVI